MVGAIVGITVAVAVGSAVAANVAVGGSGDGVGALPPPQAPINITPTKINKLLRYLPHIFIFFLIIISKLYGV
jgi:hypothetical protein